MKINRLELKNFRCFKDLQLNLNPKFNLLVGDNTVGKSSILEGLCVAAASLLVGFDEVNSRGIRKNDIRVVSHEKNIERQLPVQVASWGIFRNQEFHSLRERTSVKAKTHTPTLTLGMLVSDIQHDVSLGKKVSLPLIAYYATDRLWGKVPDSDPVPKGSRFDAYPPSLNSISNNKFFVRRFKTKEWAEYKHKKSSFELAAVRKAIKVSFPDYSDMYYDYDEGQLMIVHDDGKILPFSLLCDGVRNMLAMIGDIAFRCAILNPHLESDAALETSGIILIDEIDLHLHPSWQKRVLKNLKESFPNMQIVATTHSPLTVSSAEENEVIIIPKHDGILEILPESDNYRGWRLDFILKDVMDIVEEPQITLAPILNELAKAFNSNDLNSYDRFLLELKNIVHDDDSILTVYKLKRSDLILKRAKYDTSRQATQT